MNTMTAMKTIGHVKATKSFELDRMFESAAQHYRIRVEPGIYPIELFVSQPNPCSMPRTCVRVRFTGTVVSSGYGAKRYANEEGKPGEISLLPYKYQLEEPEFCGCEVHLENRDALATALGV